MSRRQRPNKRPRGAETVTETATEEAVPVDASPSAAKPSSPRRKQIALVALLVIYAAAGTWFQFDFGEIMGYYTLFAQGLAAGHLYIAPTPDQVNLVDMIPFEGHYYLQWGPFPGLLHLAGNALGTGLSDRVATILATWLGAWVFLEILLLLRRRHFEQIPEGPAIWSFFAYALATPAALVAYRGTVYNESISIGATCALFSFYCLLRGQRDEAVRWPLLAGVALGAAVLTRVTLALYAPVLGLGWLAVLWLRRRDVKPMVAPALAYGAPIVLAVAVMLGYNVARFGSPLDYGNSYKPGESSHFAPFSLARVPENLGHYLFSLPDASADFPWLEHEGNQPIELVSRAEAMSSILLASPFLLFGFVAGMRLARRKSLQDELTIATLVAGAGAALMFAVLLAFASASRRYGQDFLPLASVVAFVGAALYFEGRTIGLSWKVAGAGVLAASGLLHWQIAFVQSFRTPTPDLNVARLLVQMGPTLRSIAPGPKLAREEGMARNDFGTVLVRQGRFAEAAEQFRVAAELMPGEERVRKNYELAVRRAGGAR